ncbi:hypothetical protein FE251_09640 [Georgenia wutianyii]|uniref:Uncharacterized protein n=1 Tax=Georgenia wutianyii TaxID=2585135 RepID=A0ABX5VR96_9MICO|nr:hypothetical protein [Georgenia wutianyii]QDB79604.1 hypothetical protein FE251_09640 [Georgenia wutianyii]
MGYSTDSRMKSRLAVAALYSALDRRSDVGGCVVDIDRGSQFRSRRFVHALKRHCLGGVGAAGATAAMESVFSLLEKNVLDRRSWTTHEELRIAIVTGSSGPITAVTDRPLSAAHIEFETITTAPATQAA